MSVIWINCDQGDSEWFHGRSGSVTASMFSEIRKVVGGLDARQQEVVKHIKSGLSESDAIKAGGYKSKPSKNVLDKINSVVAGERVGDWTNAAHDYAFRLAIERISGRALQDDRYEGYAARRGHELEPEARDLHSLILGATVERVGVVKTEDGKFGASADGIVEIIGKPTGCEYKCFTSPEKLRPILFDFDVADVRDQMQGGMWLSGFTRWEFGLYCPDLAPCGRELTMITEYRDDDYIENLEADMVRFDGLVEQYKQRLLKDAA